MNKIISPSSVNLNIIAPPSKSIAIRYVAVAILDVFYNNSIIKLHNYPDCDDAIFSINIAKKLGFDVILNDLRTLTISKNNNIKKSGAIEINCGESALNCRIFSFACSHLQQEINIKKSGTLKKRNLNELKKLIEQTKIGYIDANDNIIINKKLQSGEYEIDCTNSSQELTGLLIALAFCKGQSEITTNEPYHSKYIELTINILKQFNINIEVKKITNNRSKYIITNNLEHNKEKELFIEGDWSAAANFFVLGATSGNVTIANLNPKSLQPDTMILKIFEQLNIQFYEIAPNIFRIAKTPYEGFVFDATAEPDLIPPLVVLAFNAKTDSRIYGIDRLVNKESNRKEVLLKVFKMFGAKIETDGNSFIIKPSIISGGFADSHNDHRIAMAISIAAKNAKAPITLTNAEAVNKSFPGFWWI